LHEGSFRESRVGRVLLSNGEHCRTLLLRDGSLRNVVLRYTKAHAEILSSSAVVFLHLLKCLSKSDIDPAGQAAMKPRGRTPAATLAVVPPTGGATGGDTVLESCVAIHIAMANILLLF
jgi:hypothetical protein